MSPWSAEISRTYSKVGIRCYLAVLEEITCIGASLFSCSCNVAAYGTAAVALPAELTAVKYSITSAEDIVSLSFNEAVLVILGRTASIKGILT